MKVNALTVCVDYSDFLAWSIPQNRHLFNRWLIVTDTKDYKTVNLCKFYNIEYIQTDVFYENGKFNKYAGINAGLKYLDSKDWILLLDGDIVLPSITKRVFNELKLDPKFLYGIDRLNCKGFFKWIKYLLTPKLIIDYWLMTSAGFEFGSRINQYYGQQGEGGRYRGWLPLGFFQLFHSSQATQCPDNCKGADHCDLVFAKQWKREHMALIPEIIGIHLENKNPIKGQNWQGRKSENFAPEILEPGFCSRVGNRIWNCIKYYCED